MNAYSINNKTQKGYNKMREKKRITSKLAIALSLAIAAVSLSPANVQAAKAPDKVVCYLDQKYSEDNSYPTQKYFNINISNATKNDYIKVASLKSSDEDVITASGVSGSFYFEKADANFGWSNIDCMAWQPGTATISYKLGKKAKKTKVIVKDYVNPIKSITLDGVNGGKNFAKYTDEANIGITEYDPVTYEPLNSFTIKGQQKPVLDIEPTSGWSVLNVSLSTDKINEYYSFYSDKPISGKQSYTLYSIPDSGYCYLGINLINKDGGTIYVSYYLSN